MYQFTGRMLLAFLFFLMACSPSQKTGSTDNGKISVRFIQINDVYEIAPIEAGKTGGMARLATIKKTEKILNPNTFLVIAGDFLSPSVYNSLKYEDKRIRGRQMVEALNAAGLDIAAFGNHEFDINEQELQSRINESNFKWVSSNSFHKTKQGSEPFYKVTQAGNQPFPETYIMQVKDADGTVANIGFIGVNIPFNRATYVTYTDPLETAEKLYNRIKDSCDAVVALTHLDMEADIALAKKLPGLALIMGGHEHDMRYQKVGDVIISKAHANIRSVYKLDLHINKKTRSFKTKARLEWVDDSIVFDDSTARVVQKWNDIANKNYATLGFDAMKVVSESGPSYDAREATIRSSITNFSKVVVNAMEAAAPQADMAIVNAGSIRPDDILNPPITQYDILRSLPYGGAILEVDMKGSLLIKILEAGRNNRGSGGFLQYSEALFYDAIGSVWTYKKASIDANKTYHVALSDFLLTGGESNMGFLTKDNKEILKLYPAPEGASDQRSDIRLAIIKYLSNLKL